MTNAPNLLTISRFALSVVLFWLIYASKRFPDLEHSWYTAALFTFIVAGITDLLDGYIARRRGGETGFGRFADPLVDKFLICGALIFLVLYLDGDPYLKQTHHYANMTGWMVVLIVGREFLISAVRSYAESRKINFGAIGWGKRKMFTQSVTIGAILAQPAFFYDYAWFRAFTTVLIWLTVAITLFSGLLYLYRARILLKGEHG